MAVQITIRNVPQKVRDRLAARAAGEGKSMQQFLRSEILRIAERPSLEDWLKTIRARKQLSPVRVTPEEILQHRDTDRR